MASRNPDKIRQLQLQFQALEAAEFWQIQMRATPKGDLRNHYRLLMWTCIFKAVCDPSFTGILS
jgi:hypothetical protein